MTLDKMLSSFRRVPSLIPSPLLRETLAALRADKSMPKAERKGYASFLKQHQSEHLLRAVLRALDENTLPPLMAVDSVYESFAGGATDKFLTHYVSVYARIKEDGIHQYPATLTTLNLLTKGNEVESSTEKGRERIATLLRAEHDFPETIIVPHAKKIWHLNHNAIRLFQDYPNDAETVLRVLTTRGGAVPKSVVDEAIALKAGVLTGGIL